MIPHGLQLLRKCKELTHRLLACAIDGTSKERTGCLVVGSIDRCAGTPARPARPAHPAQLRGMYTRKDVCASSTIVATNVGTGRVQAPATLFPA